jgi:hypothetical protein
MRQLQLRTNPTPGLAIADVERSGAGTRTFEILKQDGTPIGTIIAEGFGVGSAPPGAPLSVTQAYNAILGGTSDLEIHFPPARRLWLIRRST